MGSFIDVEEFLNPISEGNPVGDDLRYEDEYFELEEARRADEDTASQGDWERSRKTADWNKLRSLSERLLTKRSKDLQIAAWLAEALFQLHGLPGYREGIDLVRELQTRFWAKLHPAEGDLDLRRGVYEFLDEERIFSLRIRSLPLTQVRGAPELAYSLLKYRESRESENLLKRMSRDDDPEAMLAGRLRSAEFDNAFDLTDRQFYVDQIAQLGECKGALEQLNDDIRSRWTEKNPPILSRVIAAIEDVEKLAKQLLAKKPEPVQESATSEEEPEEEAPAEDDGWSTPEPSADEPAEEVEEQPRPRARRAKPIRIDDPRAQIAAAAHALRQSDRSDPTPYLVLRALAIGKVYQAGEAVGSANFPAPSSDVRARLHGLETTGEDMAALLDEAEQALGDPEGAGWIDPQRYALSALLAEGHADAARACRAILDACLRDTPDWATALLSDGTPCASELTRAWIRDEKLGATRAPEVSLRRVTEPDDHASASADGEADRPTETPREPDAWEQAMTLRASGRTVEAIGLLARAARQARTGRERFLRTLEQAELCQADNRVELALPLLEGLAHRVDEYHLEDWEDSTLCARVFATLYRCLRGKDEARSRVVYNRLCQLDLSEALALESP